MTIELGSPRSDIDRAGDGSNLSGWLIPAERRSRRAGYFGGSQLAIGLVLLIVLISLTAFGPLLQTHDPMATELSTRLRPPGTGNHLLGTDALGRDTWSRVLAGFRWSAFVGLFATIIAGTVGTLIGLLAAVAHGPLRKLLTHVVDIGIAFPYLVIAIAIMAITGRGFWPLCITLGAVSWPLIARVVYAESLSLLERDFTLAATLLGVSRPKILTKHVIPGLRNTLVTVLAFTFAQLLIAEGSLSFLGVGAPLGVASWGNMLAESRHYLNNAPWMMFGPGSAIVFSVIAANFLGESLNAQSRRRGRGVE